MRGRLLDLFSVVGGLVVIGVGVHIYVTDPDHLAFQRLMFPVEATVAHAAVRCSEGAPEWMSELVSYAIDGQRSLANQIAYVSPEAASFHCESGTKTGNPFGARINDDTRFRFASLTKVLTADAVLELVRQDRLSLDQKLLDLLPELRPVADSRWEQVRVKHLLQHSFGADRHLRPDPMAVRNKKPWCPSELKTLSIEKLDFDAGERAAYSNVGYCLLGVIIERVTQKSYREWMESQYELSARGLRFIDGPYELDEVRYDFRNSNFYSEDYYKFFDFQALSSSAGLSGSALQLAKLIKGALQHDAPVLWSGDAGACNEGEYQGCFGYGLGRYISSSGELLYVQGGFLYGSVSQVVVDKQGGVVVWLGSGMSLDGSQRNRDFVDHFSLLRQP